MKRDWFTFTNEYDPKIGTSEDNESVVEREFQE